MEKQNFRESINDSERRRNLRYMCVIDKRKFAASLIMVRNENRSINNLHKHGLPTVMFDIKKKMILKAAQRRDEKTCSQIPNCMLYAHVLWYVWVCLFNRRKRWWKLCLSIWVLLLSFRLHYFLPAIYIVNTRYIEPEMSSKQAYFKETETSVNSAPM